MNVRAIQAALAVLFLLSGAGASAKSTAGVENAPYKVIDGKQVDAKTLLGWRSWRGAACARCHGAAQEGLVGPSLLKSMKVLSREQFKETVLQGRLQKGMPNFDGSKQVTENIDNLYSYLKGRSDGAIEPGRLKGIPK
jgi:mono/diheme cytochrome c family protein